MSRFFLLLLVTVAASAQTNAGSARALARRIQAALTAGEPVRLSYHNVNGPARQALEAALGGRTGSIDPAQVNITLTEDREGPLWVAEIVRNGKREAVLIERAPAAPQEPVAPAVAIQKTPLWEQDEPILDLAPAEPDLAVLTPAGVAIWTRAPGGWTLRQTLPIAPPAPWPRDLRGRLLIEGDALKVFLPGLACTGALRPAPGIECAPGEAPWPGEGAAIPAGRNLFQGPQGQFSSAAPGLVSNGNAKWGDIAPIASGCGPQLLASRSSEVGEPDAVQAYELRDGQRVARGAAVDFRGPVTALWPASDAGRVIAITRDTGTGRYAAFTLQIAGSR